MTPEQIKANVARNMAAREAEKQDLYSYISDEYKGLHGIRPRWIDPANYTLEQLREMANEIEAEIKEEVKRDREERRKAAIKIADAYHRREWTIGDLVAI